MDIPLSGIDPHHDISAIDDEEEQSYSAAQVLEKLERVGSNDETSHFHSIISINCIICYYFFRLISRPFSDM